MTLQLFNMLAAAALTTTGSATIIDTRSAQSLPAHSQPVLAQSLALQTIAPADPTSKHNPVNRLSGTAANPMNEGRCLQINGRWNIQKLVCQRKSAWYNGSGIRLLIGAGTAAGIGVAATESDHHSVSN